MANPKIKGLHPRNVDQVLSIMLIILFFFAKLLIFFKSVTSKFRDPGDSA